MFKASNIKAGIFFACLFLSVHVFSQFRVVGYVPLGKMTPDFSKVDFKRITHLNIAFINPDSVGNLVIPSGFDSLVKLAQKNKVKVLPSIGGGSFNPYYARLLNDTNRKAFIGKLVDLVTTYNLDGLDVDIENDNIDSNYRHLINELSAELKPKRKLLTAALATWNGQLIPDDALEKFDFINVMSYDQTGPWRPDKPGPHSTYEKAEEDLIYWAGTRGVPKEKLSLGVPFYGYAFGTTRFGEGMSYKDIVARFPGSEQKDELAPEGGGNIYYNGLPTMKRKTALALKSAGGIMIWQLLGDAQGDTSLLKAIDVMVKQPRSKK